VRDLVLSCAIRCLVPFQGGCSSGRAGLQARVKDTLTTHRFQPLRSTTSAAETIFFLAFGRRPERPALPVQAGYINSGTAWRDKAQPPGIQSQH